VPANGQCAEVWAQNKQTLSVRNSVLSTCIMLVIWDVSFMQRKSFGKTACPIARSLERVGDRWNILIIRDALHGFTRFDEFRRA
jgi:hypothetical protein